MLNRKYIFTFLFCCFYGTPAVFSQEHLITIDRQIETTIDVSNRVYIYIDSSKQQTIATINNALFQINSPVIIHKQLELPNYHYWLRFRLKNNTADTVKIFFKTNEFEQIRWYSLDGYGIQEGYGGNLSSIQKRQVEGAYNIFHTQLLPFDSSRCYIQLTTQVLLGFKRDTLRFQVKLLPSDTIQTRIDKHFISELPFYTMSIAFLAILAAIFCITTLQWLYNKDKAYLFYAGYIASLFCYFLRKTELAYPQVNVFFSYVMEWNYWFDVPTATAIYATYLLFIQAFLNTQQKYPKWHKIIKLFVLIMLIYGVASILINVVFGEQFNFSLYAIARVLFVIPAAMCMYRITKSRKRLELFILTGTGILILGCLIAFVFSYFLTSNELTGLFGIPLFYSQVGIIGELILFSVGLGYKTKLLQDKKTAADKKALVAQMKPHLIFNSLNSIKSIIQRKQYKEAINYLIKFSKYLRTVLESSSKEIITLKEELELSQLYITLESLRFKNFNFYLQIEEDINPAMIMIPPMSLQPHLENAIWHGLLPKDGDKRLDIIVKKKGATIQCLIEDNGVGRNYNKGARTLNVEKKSMGIKLTKERLQHFSITQHIIDKTDANNVSLGTIIQINIPN